MENLNSAPLQEISKIKNQEQVITTGNNQCNMNTNNDDADAYLRVPLNSQLVEAGKSRVVHRLFALHIETTSTENEIVMEDDNKSWSFISVPSDRDYCSTFLHYYEISCAKFAQLQPEVSCKVTHLEMMEAIDAFSHNCNMNQKDSQAFVFRQQDDFNERKDLISLTLRVWLMINVRSDLSDMKPFVSMCSWTDENQTLTEFVRSNTIEDSNSLVLSLPETSGMIPRFNAMNMNLKTRFTLNMTTNLADHLRFHPDDKRLDIFCCPSFLLNTIAAIEEGKNSPYTVEFLRETLSTLNILFPKTDRKFRKYLQDLMKKNAKEGLIYDNTINDLWHVSLIHDRSFRSFTHWGLRLWTLPNAFVDQAQHPDGIIQLFTDNMNKQQYFTFIIAIVIFFLTVIFGIISTVTGIMQVKIALEAAASESRTKRSVLFHPGSS